MALNKIFASTQELHRDRKLSEIIVPTPVTTIQPGVPVLIGSAAATARPAVSLTASGNATKTETNGLPAGITSITYTNGGVGNDGAPAPSASFAFDGTFEFAVTGATTSQASDVPVYITSAGALTLTAGSNTLYGRTDYPVGYRKEADRAPVKIGA